MPHPVPTTLAVHMGYESLKQRPIHLERIGAIVALWANVEMQLFDFFVKLSGGPALWVVTASIFDNIDSLAIRLGLVSRFVKMFASSFSAEFEEEIKREIRRRAQERNAVAHAKWGINDLYPDDLIALSMTSNPMRYSVPDLEEIIARIEKTDEIVGTFIVRCEATLSWLTKSRE